ncbi:MAG: hypothetical protein V7707_01200 [Motiliproteus sp.]
MALIYLVYLTCIFYWQHKRAACRDCSKARATGAYLVYGLAPLVLYVAVFIGLVGIEEWFGMATISEPYARALPFMLVGGITAVGTTGLVFSLVVYFLKPKHKAP